MPPHISPRPTSHLFYTSIGDLTPFSPTRTTRKGNGLNAYDTGGCGGYCRSVLLSWPTFPAVVHNMTLDQDACQIQQRPHFSDQAAAAVRVPATCTGTATNAALTCDLDPATDSSAACPDGCVSTAAATAYGPSTHLHWGGKPNGKGSWFISNRDAIGGNLTHADGNVSGYVESDYFTPPANGWAFKCPAGQTRYCPWYVGGVEESGGGCG